MEPIATEPNANDCSGSIDNFMFQVLMMVGGVFIFVFVIFAYTIDIVGKVNLLIIWLVICCVCAVITHWLSEFAAVVIALTLLMSIGNCSGIISTLSVEFYPTEINAMGMCFAMMIGRLGSVAGGNLIGLFLLKFCDIVFWAIVGIITTLMALATVLPEKKREKK
ncbi:uncharacterized protein LOC118733244 [Rhagoletis pomonella]|uniref:uncharacterized protein LOC118733244 n=1 Tax=Rhagoletis pomonella TaxID=28610 RepID=UPI00177B0157|nr:uncharacterized protein LOC118733244 [Rhagoletis pomonella]